MPRPLDALAWDLRTARLSPHFFARTTPEPLPEPYLVAFNAAAAPLVDLDPAAAADPLLPAVVAGGRPWPGADPLALAYAGHQFGVYVPRLGDGRALLCGEVVGAGGARVEVQLKGAGRTPFSRHGDGRAVLRSTVREYLGSEAMFGLGVPTTRALAIVGSDAPVARERVETAAVLVRLAETHVRFGSFELYAHTAQPGFVRELADFVIASGTLPEVPAGDYPALLAAAVARTASTLARWQAEGFVHGVMNTDNMSIAGLTLDYGPYAFMETFDPGFVPNHTDHEGRYAYARQPTVALWNLGCLAYALASLVPAEAAAAALRRYAPAYEVAWTEAYRRKLGFASWRGDDDELLLADLFKLLARERVDYPSFFRRLAGADEPAGRDAVAELLRTPEAFAAWHERYLDRVARDAADAGLAPAARRAQMNAANPKYVLRTHLAQRAIARAERKDFAEIARLLAILHDPYGERPGDEAYALPDASGAPLQALSCSS